MDGPIQRAGTKNLFAECKTSTRIHDRITDVEQTVNQIHSLTSRVDTAWNSVFVEQMTM